MVLVVLEEGKQRQGVDKQVTFEDCVCVCVCVMVMLLVKKWKLRWREGSGG